ncbi:hypothetical protein TMEN_10056 [Trichophyton mentagrophytes]|nr:hypothetical protein TMEN_10056 [Trichophyton mentagrophytes]
MSSLQFIVRLYLYNYRSPKIILYPPSGLFIYDINLFLTKSS